MAAKPGHDAPLSCTFDREAADILLRFCRIELLAHYLEALPVAGRWSESNLLHQLRGIGGEIDLLGHRLVVDIAFDLAPTLHLRKNPDRERLPRERIEIDAVRLAFDAAEPVGISAGEDLLKH